MGAFWNIIQAELDQERFRVSDRQLADKLGVSPTTIGNWRRGLKRLPSVRNIRAVAEFSRRTYDDVELAAFSEIRQGGRLPPRRTTTIADAVERDLGTARQPSAHPDASDDETHQGDTA